MRVPTSRDAASPKMPAVTSMPTLPRTVDICITITGALRYRLLPLMACSSRNGIPTSTSA